jgi:hypothetical protein
MGSPDFFVFVFTSFIEMFMKIYSNLYLSIVLIAIQDYLEEKYEKLEKYIVNKYLNRNLG